MSELYLEPILGWRAWKVEHGRLYSTVFGTLWPERHRLEATCGLGGRSSPGGLRGVHEAPSAGCQCGIYALMAPEDAEYLARQITPPDVPAVGRVSLWGRVIETERGYRAQYAYVYDVMLVGVTGEEAQTVRNRYAIDASVGSLGQPPSVLLPAA